MLINFYSQPMSSNTSATYCELGTMMKPKFFVAIAHTDNVACFLDQWARDKKRVSNINLFPSSLRENLLFSMSFDSTIHYETMGNNLDPIANTD